MTARTGGAAAGAGSRRVVVIGGGLAGITAAIALRESGADVALLEARPRLGGATCSFSRDGLVVDNGQHVFLRCCAAYRGLLARLGMTGAVRLQDRFDVTVLAPAGRPRRQARLRRNALPGPLHMGMALAGYPLLSLPERLRVARAALAMKRLDPADPALDDQRLGDWLAARGQSEQARRALWDLFTVSALNIAGDDANLALAATVVQTALLGRRDAADIGLPALPLGDLHGGAAMDLLRGLGAQVRVAAKVAAIEVAGQRAAGQRAAGQGGGFVVRLGRKEDADPAQPGGEQPSWTTGAASAAAGPAQQAGASAPASWADGSVIVADAVVLAVAADAAARLLPAGAAGPGPAPALWSGLGSSPIVNVHVIYDRRVMAQPFAAAVDSPVQWVFDRTEQSGLSRDRARPAGQYLAVSVSAADEQVDVPAARLRQIFLPALGELFPAARGARVTDFFVTRERRATFRQAPGCERLRPSAATALPGLAIAGAWTDTGWPDTMEGAVRSGLNAARELRRALGASQRAAAVLSPIAQPASDAVDVSGPGPGAAGAGQPRWAGLSGADA